MTTPAKRRRARFPKAARTYYPRSVKAKGDNHRRRTNAQYDATGTWTRAGKKATQAHAKAVRNSRRRSLNIFEDMARIADKVKDSIIWGSQPRRYKKAGPLAALGRLLGGRRTVRRKRTRS